LIRDHHHIAVVRDADNQVIGMVTLEDIIEELVGEIHDEFDRLPSHITTSGTGWVAGGGATLKQLGDATGIHLPTNGMTPPPATLNEWVVRKLGRPVDRGEEIRMEGLRILVRKERRQAVQEAQLSREESARVFRQ
jgi:putative hemolysin